MFFISPRSVVKIDDFLFIHYLLFYIPSILNYDGVDIRHSFVSLPRFFIEKNKTEKILKQMNKLVNPIICVITEQIVNKKCGRLMNDCTADLILKTAEADVFRVHVIVDTVTGTFTPETTLLDTTEWRCRVTDKTFIHTDHTRLELFGYAPHLAVIVAVKVIRQASACAVGDFYSFFFTGKPGTTIKK